MQHGIDRPLVWSTAALGSQPLAHADASCALDDHLQTCSREDVHLVVLRCMAQQMDAFVAPRFVTTVVFASALAGAITLLA